MQNFLAALGGFFLMLAGVSAQAEQTGTIDVQSIPSTRTLSINEVRKLAEFIISRHNFNVSVLELVSIAYIESSFRPWVQRDEGFDKSTGLMQTLLGTALDLYSKGWTMYGKPTEQSLKQPFVSMYYGAAYIHWLRKYWPNKSQEWYVRAYNGGAGWQSTPNGTTNTAHYYSKFLTAYNKFKG